MRRRSWFGRGFVMKAFHDSAIALIVKVAFSLFSVLGKEAKNQKGNLSWHLPGRGGGLEGVSSATYLF